ncbi:MAG: TrkH family potassium uptake protein [Planctomycetota bacterium]
MNLRLVSRMLGSVAWLIGAAMAFSLIWAFPQCGAGQAEFELKAFYGLIGSMVVCAVVGGLLRWYGRGLKDATLFRKEAMAVVGLSWVLATALGGLPYYLGGMVYRADAAGEPMTMGVAECLFEAQSGFSTTGATVLSQIDNLEWAPRCLLFWRSSTHFLGGLGIIVLFVAILGQGAAGKALMRAEMPGPNKDSSHERMQHTAWVFAGIYCALNVVMAVVLKLEGPTTARGHITWFEAICHAFGTMATGGFSTMDASLGGFESPLVEYTVTVFMIFAGTNFTLIYLFCLGKPSRLFTDLESRTYFLIIAGATTAVIVFGYIDHSGQGRSDFDPTETIPAWQEAEIAFRDSLFHVVSVMTTTGFGAADYDQWSNASRALFLFLMFVGACAGSTGGGMKVIRHILFVKIIGREFELSFHPSVVRHLRIGKETLTDPDLVRTVLTYVGLIAMVFTTGWLILVAIEPDSTWTDAGFSIDNKLMDSASAVAASLHNIGPGLGVVGPTQNYALFTAPAKLLFTFLMMLGRLELFAIFVLVLPSFWRTR